MKTKKNLRLADIALPLLIAAASLLIFLGTDPELSSAGDRNIAEYLSSTTKPGFFFISPELAFLLRIPVHINASVNWWTVFSLTLLFAGLFLQLYIIGRIIAGWPGKAAQFLHGLLFCSLYLTEPINFTQTAMVTAVTGILLVLEYAVPDTDDPAEDADGAGRKAASGLLKLLSGAAVLLLACSIRYKAAVLCIPFGLMCLAYPLLPHRGTGMKPARPVLRKTLSAALALISVCILSFGIRWVYGRMDPYYPEYTRANTLRENIYDYLDRYPGYPENEEAYNSAGITPVWIGMLEQCFTSDQNYFGTDTLSRMEAFRTSGRIPFRSFLSTLKPHIASLAAAGAAVCLIFLALGPGNAAVPLLLCLASFMAGGIFFTLIGRIEWRVTNGVLLSAMASFIWMSARTAGSNRKLPELPLRTKGLRTVVSAILYAAVLLSLRVAINGGRPLTPPKAAEINPAFADYLDYQNSHPDTIYYVTNGYYEAHNAFTGKDPDYLKNQYSVIANFILGRHKELEKRGITSLTYDMLYRDDVLMEYNPVIRGYLQTYYDPCISCSIADVYAPLNIALVNYRAPVITAGSVGEVSPGIPEEPVLSGLDLAIMDAAASPADYRVFALEAAVSGETFDRYALNVRDMESGNVYTYPLTAENGLLLGKMVWLDGSWDFAGSSRIIIGEKEGAWYDIWDITGAPVFFR